MIKAIITAASLAALVAPDALALTESEARRCQTLAAGFEKKRQDIEIAQAERDAAVVTAEDAGEAWENAEAERLFGEPQAAAADAAKAAYDDAKAAHQIAEARLFDLANAFQRDAAFFNQTCVADD